MEPGKWSPAQHVVHLTLAYELFARGVRYTVSPHLVGKPWQRRLWRLVGLATLRQSLAEFECAAQDAAEEPPRLMHPYFGAITMQQALVLCAVHTRHHAAIIRPD